MTTALQIRTIECQPYQDQRPGTAGLRKKVAVFQQPDYLETFLEAIFRTVEFKPGDTLVVGGDGRYLNEPSIQCIIRMAAAHGLGRIVTGRNGLLSTPAASILIRQLNAAGGLLLTASHNPGGPDGDFGIKYNTATGGQAPESLTEAIYQTSRQITSYRLADIPETDLEQPGEQHFGEFCVRVLDATSLYANYMEQLFDFDCISAWIGGKPRMCFDALNAVTGPYALEIFCKRLGAPRESILHAEPKPDFGGLHPDPNPVDAHHLLELSRQPDAPELIAASDGDGDRNMILSPAGLVSPCDSIAILLAHAKEVPGYRKDMPGVARSMPTSRAVDAVASSLGIECYETPTGWRYFCNLLEAGLIGLCGEESFGTGSSHAREKDGLWAVLFWLNLLAIENKPVGEIVTDHWRQYGRHYYQRQDFFIPDAGKAQDLIQALREQVRDLDGQIINGQTVEYADDFHYHDPVDHSESAHQGIRLIFDDHSRIVYRLSGTGTSGATLRVYLERFTNDSGALHQDTQLFLAGLAERAMQIGRITEFTGLTKPTASI